MLTSSDPGLSVPPSVKVSKGWSVASFAIVTQEVSTTLS